MRFEGKISLDEGLPLLLLGNLFPLTGIAVLGWQLHEVLFVYWLEVGFIVVLYSGLVLFASREPRPDDQNLNPPSLPIPLLETRTGQIQPVGWMPPIYRRNVPYAVGLFVWGLVFWWSLSVLLIIFSYPEPVETGAEGRALFGEGVAAITATATPGLLLNGLVLLAAQLLFVRHFFAQHVYETLSAPMIAEIPARQIGFWIVVGVGAQIVVPLLLWPVAIVFDAKSAIESGIPLLTIFAKVTMEWSIYGGRWIDQSDGLARWFTPSDPQTSSDGW
ncbi:DUF6498-containing protein [Halostagnicola kamekurae]|uniref:Uncharacterized protein n=1 Tax=Halostagnicola kamekurae TaxID=619731 RepID=A0A1I6RQP2_9EURY|nr:DUF6498-containing protein [Halostagnicola kamekurae]SFS67041.1 hypothetical protein SAMN04488556_2002 [Halostagnicola kamekurae]